MTVSTRGLVFEGVGRPLGIESLVLDEPQRGEVLVRMVASGVCHSDLHVVDGEWERPANVVLGHEGAAVVEALGPDVPRDAVREGDLVVLAWTAPCGTCPACGRSEPWLCSEPRGSGHRLRQGTVSGLKFEDDNADGLNAADPADAPLAGWEIRAYVDTNANGSLDAGETTVADTDTTALDGSYTLTLDPGSYVVCEVSQATWFQSAPANTNCAAISTLGDGGHAETVTSGSSSATGNDFGNFRQGTVSGLKWEDKNGDGVRDADGPDNILGNADDEAGLIGWTIFVDYNNSTALDGGEPSALTAADGSYTITGVNPGTWTLREAAQSGWTCSFPNPGASSPKVSTNCTYSVAVTSGGSVIGKDFGNWTTGTVSGTKWEDKNGDGVRDADGPDNIPGNADDEAGLIGWTIKAFTDDGNGTLSATEGAAAPSSTVTTSANGTYTLLLNPGSYVILRGCHE